MRIHFGPHVAPLWLPSVIVQANSSRPLAILVDIDPATLTRTNPSRVAAFVAVIATPSVI